MCLNQDRMSRFAIVTIAVVTGVCVVVDVISISGGWWLSR